MRFVLLFVIAMACSCGHELLQVGDPCEPEQGWCCLPTGEHLVCFHGFMENAHPEGKDSCICETREPGFRPCT